jgi:hypothetical protein
VVWATRWSPRGALLNGAIDVPAHSLVEIEPPVIDQDYLAADGHSELGTLRYELLTWRCGHIQLITSKSFGAAVAKQPQENEHRTEKLPHGQKPSAQLSVPSLR